MTSPTRAADGAALARLREREEVLQICYWFEGEGLGPLSPDAVTRFLNSSHELVEETFDTLTAEGDLCLDGRHYVFTDQGKRKAAKMFAESFTEFQLGGHGECTAGCCDEDEVCEHEHAHGGHGHVHG